MHARQNSGPRVVLTGGGTGGHVYPALAVAEAIRQLRPEVQLLYVGGDRMEADAVPAAGLHFRAISVHGLAGRGLPVGRRLRAISELATGLPLWQSVWILCGFRPDVVLGTGGYVSGPVLLAARGLRIPCAALDGNRVPGHTTRIVARLVDVMAVAHAELRDYFSTRLRHGAQVELTGLPVRREITAASRETGAAALGLDSSSPIVLVLGGSLGSQRINRAVTGACELLSERAALPQLQILHVTGERFALPCPDCAPLGGRYRPVPYLGQDYPQALSAADLVLSRAGASTVAEITARGLPAILVPWAGAATGEQTRNAEALRQAGAALVIPDRQLSPERLADALTSTLGSRPELERMAAASKGLGYPRAAERVAELVLELVSRRSRPARSGN